MNHIITMIKKQLKDTLKNKAVLIQFVMFPFMGVFMTNAVKIDGMPPNFFTNLFASMYVGMAPLVAMSAIISEEKEKNTLRVLRMAGVTPWEYLAGIGCYVFTFCMAGAAVFCLLLEEGTPLSGRLLFFAAMAVGTVVSLTVGAAIGVGCPNQMSATSVTVPVMMVFSFLPMLSTFNETVAKAAKYLYSEQLRIVVNAAGEGRMEYGNPLAVAMNLLAAGGLFWVLYRKRGLEL